MPRNAAFSEALAKVSSDKIKERAEGMETLRTIFQSQASVENLSGVTDGAGWLQTFQTLFGVVKMERAASSKKGKTGLQSSSAAETRLSNAMGLVRWLVDRSLVHLNKKVINALFSHLTQTIIATDGKLLRNSMDYIKALKTIVSYAPHLEHLGSASWESLMSICWDAALGRKIEYDKAEWTTGDLEEESAREEESEKEEDVEMMPATATGKRKFTSTMSSIDQRGKNARNPDVGPLSTEVTELLGIVPVLLAVPNAPILPPPKLSEADLDTDKPLPRVGIRILRKTIKFLRERPAETTAHRSVLTTLIILLGELELNAVQVMIETAPTLLSLLVPLWHTKLKDQVVLALRIILPFLSSSPFVCDKEPEEKKISREVFGDLLALRDAISRSNPGKRSNILDLSFLSLKIVRTSAGEERQASSPMHTPLVSATADISDAMIMTWATLELMADSLVLLHQHHEATSLRSATPSRGSNKRQRIEEPVAEMLSVMTSARHAESRLFALQTMYLFVMRHWDQMHSRLQTSIRTTLQGLMVDPVPEVQQWADIDLAAICHLVADVLPQKPALGAASEHEKLESHARGNDDWLEIWQLALRKLVVTAGPSSRSAALLLQVILQKQLVEPVLIITSIGKFLEGVSDQGPAAPYDAVCDFMVICLDTADQDARLHRMGLTSRVSEWFRTAWLAQAKSTAEAAERGTFDVDSAFRLVCRLAALPTEIPTFNENGPLTSTSLFIRMQQEDEILDIRDFILNFKLPPLPRTTNSAKGTSARAATATARPFAASEARALSRLFGLKLQQLSLTEVDTSNVARLRLKLDGCVLILLAESTFIDSDPEHSQANFDRACDLLEDMLQLTLQKSWTLGERAKLFVGLDALFPDIRSATDLERYKAEELISLPGFASGILSVITSGASTGDIEPSQETMDIKYSPLHIKLWQKPKLCDIFRSRVRDFYQVLQAEDLHLSGTAANADTDDADDDFTIKADDDMTSGSAQSDTKLIQVIVTGCIRCCLLPKYCANGMSMPVKDRNILNILINAEPSVFLQLCYPVFLCVRIGLLEFNDEAALRIYEVLRDYMSSYTYSLSSAMRQTAANFVNTLLSRLSPLGAESFHTGAGELVTFFLEWLGTNLSQGKVIFWQDRLMFVRLFARLIELDPRNVAWSQRKEKDPDYPIEDVDDPVLLMGKLVDDTDARVRFRIDVIVARLFQSLPDQDFTKLYRKVVTNFQTRGFQVEYILSVLVFQLNVTIVNAVGRFNSLFHIYDTAYHRAFARNHIQVSLQCIVRALRLSGIAVLYLQYAARLAVLQLDQDDNPEDLPMQLYGFSTRKEWASAALTTVGSAALLRDKTWVWEHLSATSGLTKEEGLQHIFSTTVGYHLAFAFTRIMPERFSDKDWTVMSKLLRDFEEKYTASGGKGIFEFNPIDTISLVICMPGDEDTTADLKTILADQDDGSERSRVFADVYCTGGSAQNLEAVLHPVTDARSCIRVMQWVEKKNKQMGLDVIVYNVLMQTVGRLDAKILINERRRLVRNLTFFIAYYHQVFLSNAVLGFVLLRTGAVLAQHQDLAPISSNLISWILPRMKFLKGADADLVAILAKLSAVAMTYVKKPTARGIAGLQDAGSRILEALEAFLDNLWRPTASSSLRAVAFMPLLPIWPRTLPKTPNKRLQEMSRTELLQKAQDPAIHKQVFSLTRQLASKSGSPRDSEIDIFSSRVFWQLKDALSGTTVPSPEEMSAFFEFCYFNGGRVRMIDPSTYAALRTRTIRSRNRTTSNRSNPAHSISDILFGLFDRLHSADLGSQHRAYRTLCVVGSAMSSLAQQAVGLTTIAQLELGLLFSRSSPTHSDEAAFMNFIGSGSLLEVDLALPLSTDIWVTMFASATCMQYATWDNMLVDVAPLFEHDHRFSRQVLPQLLHLVLDKEASDDETADRAVQTALSTYLGAILQSCHIPLSTKTVIMEILLYLRRQSRPGLPNHLGNDRWLEIDFAVIAKAALDCKMFATALLYWELHVDPDNENAPKAYDDTDYQLLYDIYNNIDEPDGFYGIPLESNAKNALLQRFQHESNWSLAFKYYGAELEANSHTAQHLPQLTRSLQAFGMDRLALMLFQAEDDADLSQHHLPYDLAWRTQSWDLPTSAFLPESSDRSIYTALRTIHRSRDVAEMQKAVQDIKREELESIRTFSLEDVHGVRKKMQELLSLREIGRWTGEYLGKVDSAEPGDHDIQRFLEVPACIEPDMTEQILSVRLSLIRSARSQDEWQLGDMMGNRGKVLLQLERQCLQQLGSLARQRGDLDGAIKFLAKQQSLTPSDAADHVSEFAEVLWLQGDHGLAIDQLKTTLRIGGSSQTVGKERVGAKLSRVMESKLLSRVGQWMAEAKQADPGIIYDEYFQKAYDTLEKSATKPLPEDIALIHSRFAAFADAEYARLIQLTELEQRHLVQQRLAADNADSDSAPAANRRSSATASSRRTQANGTAQVDAYAVHREFEAIKRQYLQQAINMYASSMRWSDKYDDSVHRMCALWLENSADNAINTVVEYSILRVPTYKFAFLASQLTARLDAEDVKTKFQPTLQSLLSTLCEEHPFHIMYQVITLARPVQLSAKMHSSARGGKTPRGVNGRELAASNLLDQIRALPRRTAQISDMELFATASIHWCDFKQERGKTREYQVPPNVPIAKLQDLRIPVPTQHLPFDKSGSYSPSDQSEVAFIQSYERTFTLAGGIHKPKIMNCLGHDGRRFRQLFKGDDDLRQDSVMEQVFTLVNTLLQRDEAIAKRELRFKTYIVLPLANSTGIIEFVLDSIGIGEWLSGAHRRFRPMDVHPQKIRDDMKVIQDRDSNAHAELIQTFLHHKKNFQPVMRHFFTEMRNDPVGWYAMRLKYARSVAVGCMVGHLVGLGDRHCSNIMINTKTGEILHIDLGIAFDQGADLNIPERVPFRLTADTVDGLGSFGVDGVFKRCCEQTLRLLREKADLILAVLEVFRHDPLQRWKADFDKINQMQGGTAAKAYRQKMEAHASELATSALDRVRTKLLNNTTVEYTVNELIRTATDPVNLATIFHGWQPWM
ncbi:Serine/threonine-protein kinase tel1, variant 2 [Naganishia albida]|nr:Serine/threonine-protein kinase tel1, variant 2 [Naganishia albida]